MNNVKMLVADVTNILSIHEAVGQIISEQGRIDVLINNAGMVSVVLWNSQQKMKYPGK